jgi:hypothetical protein
MLKFTGVWSFNLVSLQLFRDHLMILLRLLEEDICNNKTERSHSLVLNITIYHL